MNETIASTINWKRVNLGDVATYLNGRAFKPSEWEQSGRPIIRIQNLNKDHANYNYTTNEYEDRYRVELGDLLFAWSASLGVYIWKGQSAWLNQHIFKVVPQKTITKEFLFYTLEKITAELYAKAHGSGMVHVTKGKFESTEILLPEIQEQQAIVSKLEELFSKLDKGVESLKTLQQQLKVYRQAVLKWAFEGRLTNTNVKDGELPEGWIKSALGNYIENIEAGKSFKCEERPPDNDKTGVLKVSAVTWGEFDEQESKTVVDDSKVNPNYFVKIGDFLFSRANTIELVGACVVVKHINKQLMLSDKTLRFEFKSSLSKTYALYYLRSFIGKKQIQKLSTGNQESMRNIGQSKIKQIEIVLPDSLELQNKVVQEIESRLSVCDKIEETITNGLKEAEALRQSILKQAFEGELI